MDNLSEFVLFEYQKLHPKLNAVDLACELIPYINKFFKEARLIEAIKPEVILSALSHKSFVHELKADIENYERLEFLGDAFLDLYVSEKLFAQYPDLKEGQLSKLRSNIVNEETLSSIAIYLGIDKIVLLGKGELKEKGNEKNSILCNVFESILGAVYLSQGVNGAYTYLDKVLFYPKFKSIWDQESLKFFDAKSTLQEEVMKIYKTNPEYKSEEVEEDKTKLFKVELWIENRKLGELTHQSKKKGMQLLAKQILENKSYQRIENVN
jgi:ribonuclease-3